MGACYNKVTSRHGANEPKLPLFVCLFLFFCGKGQSKNRSSRNALPRVCIGVVRS